MPILKANAYGLGVVEISRAIETAKVSPHNKAKAQKITIGVAEPFEALEIRENLGDKVNVQVMSAILPDEIAPMISNEVRLPVTGLEEAKEINKQAQKLKAVAHCHLKLDTGMGRLGIFADDALSIIKQIKGLPNLDVEGIFTHCPMAYDPDDPFTADQIKRFKALIKECGAQGIRFKRLHMAASDAINNWPDTCRAPFNVVRTGINLYGSFDPNGMKSVAVKNVLTLTTRVAQVRTYAPGKTLGYGRTWCVNQPTKVATISAGYADGLPLALSNRGKVIIGGKFCPVIGRISMDYTTVDVSHVNNVKAGDEVILLGAANKASITPDDWGRLKGTHAYEIICALGNRVQRCYV